MAARLTLGRGKDCDLVFPGTHLSRQHLAITLHEDHLALEDLNSANGTFVNETRIQTSKAVPGDKLRLDVYTFKVIGPSPSEAKTQLRPRPPRRFKTHLTGQSHRPGRTCAIALAAAGEPGLLAMFRPGRVFIPLSRMAAADSSPCPQPISWVLNNSAAF